MSDHVERAAQVIHARQCSSVCASGPLPSHWEAAEDLDAAGLLATRQDVIFSLTSDEREVVAQTYAMIPASPEHDAAVAAKVLRQEANGPWWEDPSDDDDWTNGYRAAMRAILSKADHIEKNGIRNE